MNDSKHHPILFVIIPAHNRKDLTVGCLAHLADTGDYQRHSILVIDDGSTDGTADAIREKYPEVIILKGNGNLWWTGATAMGMSYAYDLGADYFMWLNDDCRPAKGAIASLLEYAEANRNTIIAPTIYPENCSTPYSNGFLGRHKIRPQAGHIHDADGVAGLCALIPRAAFDRVGIPDSKKYPHYSGDDTYTLRAKRAGFRIQISGNIRADLIGKAGENHDISNYAVRNESIAKNFQRLFGSIKSPYYLPTKYNFYREKFSPLPGMGLFAIKLGYWSLKLLWLRWLGAISHNREHA